MSPIHKLPQQMIPFIGRTIEIADIVERLNDPNCRLLTLVGPGGIGKTRLAIEAISGDVRTFQDGIYFVPLQSVASIDNIIPTIASVIGFEPSDKSDLESQLTQHLGDKSLLLILDNFEHLLDATLMISRLLMEAPKLKILVTSREALKLRMEWVYHVDGLAFPSSTSTDSLERYDAVRLFNELAIKVQRNFVLATERESVVQICRLVQGMPLAIELAATWLRRLPCIEIVAELQRSLDFLETDLHDLPDRHRSMRVVFDHSWKLLMEEEQNVFMALSVFRGGFLQEASEQIVGASRKLLMSLVDKSILKVNHDGRYEIHELQRQYAEEKLCEEPRRKTKIFDQHSAYYLKFMDLPIRAFLGPKNRETLRSIDAEIDNIRSAWNWGVVNRHTKHMKLALVGLYWYSWLRSWHEAGERIFQQAVETLRTVESTKENKIALGQALLLQAAMDNWLGRSQLACVRSAESVKILQSIDARYELAQALAIQGWANSNVGNLSEAKQFLRKAVEGFEETNQYEVMAHTLGLLGYIAQRESDHAAIEYWHQRALQVGRRIGDHRTISDALGALGFQARWRGQYHKARQLVEESLAVAREAEIIPFVIFGLNKLGVIAQVTGDFGEAKRCFEESTYLARMAKKPVFAWCLINLANVLTSLREFDLASGLYQEALEAPPGIVDEERYATVLMGLGQIAQAREDYATAQAHYETSLSLRRKMGEQTGIILSLLSLARIGLEQKDIRAAPPYLLEALQAALITSLPPLVLDAIVMIADMFMQQGNLADSVRLATLVGLHPASTAEVKDHAGRLLARLEAELFASDLKTALQQGSQADLNSVAQELVEQIKVQISQPLVEPLSERELQVLHLLASGKTNREIASDLTLGLSTIKTHLHHIYQKLEVNSRTLAIARARDLNLL